MVYTHRFSVRVLMFVFAGLAFAAVAGCGAMENLSPHAAAAAVKEGPANLVTLSTQMLGANEVPPVPSNASGTVNAIFNKDTNLLRWKISFSGLSGRATAGHFHGPAAVGTNAGVALGWPGVISSPMEGSATLTLTQAADLLAGRWYANIHTPAHPSGEIRGQMTVRD